MKVKVRVKVGLSAFCTDLVDAMTRKFETGLQHRCAIHFSRSLAGEVSTKTRSRMETCHQPKAINASKHPPLIPRVPQSSHWILSRFLPQNAPSSRPFIFNLKFRAHLNRQFSPMDQRPLLHKRCVAARPRDRQAEKESITCSDVQRCEDRPVKRCTAT
jgi:hypothetical protein